MVRSLLPEGGRGIAVFDITNAQSFDNLGTLILALVDIAGTEMTIFVAGNKVDLEDGRRVGARELLPVVRDGRRDGPERYGHVREVR